MKNNQPSQQESPFRFSKSKNAVNAYFSPNGVNVASLTIREEKDKILNKVHAALFFLAALHTLYGDEILNIIEAHIKDFKTVNMPNKIILPENIKN